MLRVGFELTTSVFQLKKRVHTLDGAATVISTFLYKGRDIRYRGIAQMQPRRFLVV
jgi:hypothetical protein